MNDGKQINTKKRFFGLDFLRVLAVSMILFSHSSWIYNSTGILGKLQDMSGFFGIELFIVLSGFLIGGILYKQFQHGNYTLKDASLFVYRRLMRLLPSYYLVILINAIIFSSFGFSIAAVWKYFLLLQNFCSPVSPFFPESWSLPVKEMGYIFAVFLLLIFSNIFVKTSKRVLFLTVITCLITVTFLLKINYDLNAATIDLRLWSFNIRSVVIYRMDSVLIGVLFGYFFQNYKEFMLSKAKLFLMFSILVFGVLLFCVVVLKLRLTDASWFWNVLCLPLVSLAICLFIPFLLNWKSPSEKIENGIRFICNISYSVYLLHYSFILFLLKYFIDTTNYTIWQLNLFTLGYIGITVFLSYIMYTYFEKPINDYRTKNLKLDGK
jgi:peptidoglycan/LPS O-acetylase OafA/YrhL